MNTTDRIEREQYADRLMNRMQEVVKTEAPEPLKAAMGLWDLIAEADRQLVQACSRFERGQIDKTQLDRIAVAFLAKVRQSFYPAPQT